MLVLRVNKQTPQSTEKSCCRDQYFPASLYDSSAPVDGRRRPEQSSDRLHPLGCQESQRYADLVSVQVQEVDDVVAICARKND